MSGHQVFLSGFYLIGLIALYSRRKTKSDWFFGWAVLTLAFEAAWR